MATLYTSSEFVESAGAILFHLSTQRICLIRLKSKNQYLLPKGRLGMSESRQSAALREAQEETGYYAKLLPLTMPTRATPVDEDNPNMPDKARVEEGLTEAVALHIRKAGRAGDVKLVWWFVAAIDEDAEVGRGEEGFEVGLWGYEDAMEKLSFEDDRKALRTAIELLEGTYGKK